jgi:hypothetical protein
MDSIIGKEARVEACTEQRRHFSSFAVSMDGVIGKEARALLCQLSALLADKWDQLTQLRVATSMLE